MKFTKEKVLLFLSLAMLSITNQGFATNMQDLEKRSIDSASTLAEVMAIPEQAIPKSLLKRAECIAVYPNVLKIGFLGGYETGKGMVSCRTKSSNGIRKWSAPIYTRIKGISFGFQWGIKKTDIILVLTNKSASKSLANENFTLGVDASVAAGPVGRDLKIGVDYKLDSAVYTYSKTKGVFLGVALDGAALFPHKDANRLYHGTNNKEHLREILTDSSYVKSTTIVDFIDSLQLHAL